MSEYVDACSTIGQGRGHESRPADQAISEMDQAGIQCAWVHPTEQYTAIQNREGNDFVAGAVASNPERFVGCAVANPWRGAEAASQLRDAFACGLRVLYLAPHLQGFHLSDPIVDSLIEVAIEHRAPVYAHTGTPICAMPFQLAALARRHPSGKFIMGHMGYSDFWYDVVPAAGTAPNVWIETSFIDGDMILEGVKQLGAERFVFGTAAPLGGVMPEMRKVQSLTLGDEQIQKIMRTNAEDLLA